MAVGQKRIIHRFIRPIADYEEGGIYYTQIIPTDTQAYAYYPEDSGRNCELWYVFGDGVHTYIEIRDGKGKTESSKEFPVFTSDFANLVSNTYTKEEIDEFLSKIHSFRTEIVEKLPDIGDPTVLYLVPKRITHKTEFNTKIKNYYSEYVWLEKDKRYEHIGNTTSGDASDFVTYDELQEILTAENVRYTNENYDFTNVKEALDYLLYKIPEVTLHGGDIYEKGTILQNVDLIWEVNKIISNQILYPSIGKIDSSLRAYTVENANISEDTTYKILVSDGQNSATSETQVLFKKYIYWGSSSSLNLENDEIIGFSKAFENIDSNSVIFDCSGGKYFYIIAPVEYNRTMNFKINGFVFSDMIESEITLRNASGYESLYTVYRSNNIQTGSSIEVEYFI